MVPPGRSNRPPLTSACSVRRTWYRLVSAGDAADLSTCCAEGEFRLNAFHGVQSLSEIGSAAVPHWTTPSAFMKDGPKPGTMADWSGRPRTALTCEMWT